MTTTTLRSVPRELPHARIYLDDLFEIEDILKDAAMRLPSPVNVTFEYIVDRSLRVTTREELIEHGGHSSYFELQLISDKLGGRGLLSLIGMGHIQFDLPYFFEKQEWEIYGKVATIFEARSYRVKNFAELIPNWFGYLPAVWALCYFSIAGLAHMKFNATVVWLIAILLMIPMVVGTVGIWKKNRIYFRYIRPDRKERKAAWKARFEKLVWLVIGLALGLIFDRLKR